MTQQTKLQWRWVGISFLIFAVFYIVPLVLVGGIFEDHVIGKISGMFVGGWVFGGILIISATIGYIFKKITILEPSLAAASVVAVFFITFFILQADARLPILPMIVTIGSSALSMFLLSLLGAWFGKRVRQLSKPAASEST